MLQFNGCQVLGVTRPREPYWYCYLLHTVLHVYLSQDLLQGVSFFYTFVSPQMSFLLLTTVTFIFAALISFRVREAEVEEV